MDLFAKDRKPRRRVISARDRCDYTIDRIRAINTADGLKYIRNGMVDRPWSQPQYRDGREYMTVMRRLYDQGKLNEAQARFWGPIRPAEELYDLNRDPHEVNNLAAEPAFQIKLASLRNDLDQWIKQTGDRGQEKESDQRLYAVYRQWGNKCVNSEYDPIKANFKALEQQRVAILANQMGYVRAPDQAAWKVRRVDSEQAGNEARYALDGKPFTLRHTGWSDNQTPKHPHTLDLDLGAVQTVRGFRYLPRQTGLSKNGTVARFRIELSQDAQTWAAAAEGNWKYANGFGEKRVLFKKPITARYVRFIALSEINNGPWASAAEINVTVDGKP